METSLKRNLSRALTVAYLLAAGGFTIATSKAQPMGGSGGTLTTSSGSAMNYAVQSNCSSEAYAVSAVRVEGPEIEQTLDRSAQINSPAILDFRSFGFPQGYLLIGMNQSSTTDSTAANRQCLVRSKTSTAYAAYDSTQTLYSYLQPGYLTTVRYDCYNGTSYVCSSTFSELGAGSLSDVAQ